MRSNRSSLQPPLAPVVGLLVSWLLVGCGATSEDPLEFDVRFSGNFCEEPGGEREHVADPSATIKLVTDGDDWIGILIARGPAPSV